MINSIKIKNYRSIKEIQLENLTHLNILIGRNSQGKSNIISALYNTLFYSSEALINVFPLIGNSDFDYHHKNSKEPIDVTLYGNTSGQNFEAVFRVMKHRILMPRLWTQKRKGEKLFSPETKAIGYLYQLKVDGKNIYAIEDSTIENVATVQTARIWQNDTVNLKNALTHNAAQIAKRLRLANEDVRLRSEIWKLFSQDYGLHSRNIEFLHDLLSILNELPENEDQRQITDGVTQIEHLINGELKSLQLPDFLEQNEDGNFRPKDSFVRESYSKLIFPGNTVMELENKERLSSEHAKAFVTERIDQDGNKRIEDLRSLVKYITGYDVNAFQEKTKGTHEIVIGEFPANSCGSGVHGCVKVLWDIHSQKEGSIILIEEPENGMHPQLIKRFFSYLVSRDNHQCFLATHSAHVIDTNPASIYLVICENGETKAVPAITDRHKWSICDELGFRASDLLQSNCILWVEGPSDRLYLRNWLRKMDPELTETHYSIMFYGGSLRSHLSAKTEDEDKSDVEEVNDFIELLKINRNCMMLMDSDKDSASTEPNLHKLRLTEELKRGNGFAWETLGRTIENYTDKSIVYEAIKKIHPDSKVPKIEDGQFAKAFVRTIKRKTNKKGEEKIEEIACNKVKVAQLIVDKHPVDFKLLDLKDRVSQTANFIRKVNGLPPKHF